MLASDMRAGEPEVLAQEVDQQTARLGPSLARLPVHGHADFSRLGHRHRLRCVAARSTPPRLCACAARSVARMLQSPAGQHAGQMTAVLDRSMQVRARIDELGCARGGVIYITIVKTALLENFFGTAQ